LEDSFCGLTLLARSDILEIKRSLKDDFVGRFYVRKPDGTGLNSYYKTLEALRPLIEDKDACSYSFFFGVLLRYKTLLITKPMVPTYTPTTTKEIILRIVPAITRATPNQNRIVQYRVFVFFTSSLAP